MFLVGGPDGDFNVLTQGGEKFHEASDREIAGAVSHEQETWGCWTPRIFAIST